MSKRTQYVLLIGILIIAGFFRFYHLTVTPPGLYMDEAMDGANAQNVVQTGNYKVYYPEDNGREGLYINILAIAFKYHILPDNAPWSVRVPAAVAGFLTVLGLYLMVGELFEEESRTLNPESRKNKNLRDSRFTIHDSGSAIALLAAFLLATSFWHINFSRIGFRAIFAPLCLVWTTYLLLKLFRTRNNSVVWLLALLAGVIYAAGFYTYIAFRITPLLLLFFIPFFSARGGSAVHGKKNPAFWKRMFLFLIVTFIVALPIGWYYLRHPADFLGRTSQISVASSASPFRTIALNSAKTALMFNWQGDFNWRHNLSGAPQLWWPVGILFVLGMILALVLLFSKKTWEPGATGREKNVLDSPVADRGSTFRFPILFLFAWLVLGALPEVLSNDGIPHALRSLLMVIPAVVFAAMGGIWIYEKIFAHWHPNVRIALLAVCIAAAIGATYATYFKTWAQNSNVPGSFNADYVAIGNAINRLPPDVQKYVIVYAGGVTDYGIPMPAMPVMYVTRSFVPDAAKQKFINHIHYLLPSEIDQIPAAAPRDTIFEIR